VIKKFFFFLLIISIVFGSVFAFLKYSDFFEKKEPLEQETSLPPELPAILLGESYFEEGFYTLALEEFLEALEEEQNPSQQKEIFLKIGETHSKLKNFESAIENFKHAGHIQNSPELQLRLVKEHIRMFDIKSADARLPFLEGVFEEADFSIFLHKLLAGLDPTELSPPPFIENKKLSDIHKAYETFALYKDSPSDFLLTLIVKSLEENKEYEYAILLGEKIIEKNPEYRDALLLHGYASLAKEMFEKASLSFKKAYEIDPLRPDTQYFLGVTLEALGNKKDAYSYYDLAYKNGYTPRIHVLQKLADLSFEFELYSQALNLYEEFLTLSKNDPDDFIRPVFIALEKQKNYEKAENFAKKALSYFPESAQSYNLLAWVSLESGDIPLAQSYINKSFEINPLFAPAHLNQGHIYVKLESIKEALESYEKAYSFDKNGPIGERAIVFYNELLQKYKGEW
jgi:tetratricopeptide (TPR) repeat protein